MIHKGLELNICFISDKHRIFGKKLNPWMAGKFPYQSQAIFLPRKSELTLRARDKISGAWLKAKKANSRVSFDVGPRDQRAFVFAAREHCIKGKQCQHITIKNQNMSLCSKHRNLIK